MKKNGELSLEQLRQRLHISKRKAAWMLNNGVIPCRIVNTPTHLRYYVSEEDLDKYLFKPQAERSREIPVGVFSSRKEKSLPLEKGGRDSNVNIELTSNERAMFIHLLEKRMEIYPDAMDINRVAKITGYSRTTILRRVQNGDMFAVMMNDEYVLSKAGVIEFFASNKAFRIYNKSKWHEKAVEYLWKKL
jgi:hypothetical protein